MQILDRLPSTPKKRPLAKQDNENRRLFFIVTLRGSRPLPGFGGRVGLNRFSETSRAPGLQKLHEHTGVIHGQLVHLAKVPKWQPGRK